jgi:hypothetical protein
VVPTTSSRRRSTTCGFGGPDGGRCRRSRSGHPARARRGALVKLRGNVDAQRTASAHLARWRSPTICLPIRRPRLRASDWRLSWRSAQREGGSRRRGVAAKPPSSDGERRHAQTSGAMETPDLRNLGRPCRRRSPRMRQGRSRGSHRPRRCPDWRAEVPSVLMFRYRPASLPR